MNVYANGCPGRIVAVEGQTLLFFSGTSYLGLADNKAFHDKIKEGLDQYGSNFAVSRSSNIRLDIYDRFERFMAKEFLFEDCMTLSSGYLAGRLLVDYYFNKGRMFYSPDVHPTLWGQGERKANGQSFESWADETVQLINTTDEAHYIIFTNSLSNLSAVIYPFDWLNRIHPDKNVTVIIDDSHGIGVVGKEHKGISELLPPLRSSRIETVVVDSIGKALGIPGGVIFGRRSLLEQLRHSPFYTGSSPIIPAYLFAFMQTGSERKKAMECLSRNIAFFKAHAPSGITDLTYDYPVFLLKDDGVAEYCLDKGILLSSFPYPKPEGANLTRIVLNACHTEEDLLFLIQTLKAFYGI